MGFQPSLIAQVLNIQGRHLVSIPPGPHLLSDILISSPILAGDRGIPEEAMGDAGAGSSSAAGGSGYEFGVDPSLDPELAMVRILHLFYFYTNLLYCLI